MRCTAVDPRIRVCPMVHRRQPAERACEGGFDPRCPLVCARGPSPPACTTNTAVHAATHGAHVDAANHAMPAGAVLHALEQVPQAAAHGAHAECAAHIVQNPAQARGEVWGCVLEA